MLVTGTRLVPFPGSCNRRRRHPARYSMSPGKQATLTA
jgi:hypothetical protein